MQEVNAHLNRGCASEFCKGFWLQDRIGYHGGQENPLGEELPPTAPINFDFEGRWRVLSEEVIAGIKEWRLQHPKATLQEIEAAVDERLAQFRARMPQDVALASRAVDLRQTAPSERPVCPAS